jgi:hypothetical protein
LISLFARLGESILFAAIVSEANIFFLFIRLFLMFFLKTFKPFLFKATVDKIFGFSCSFFLINGLLIFGDFFLPFFSLFNELVLSLLQQLEEVINREKHPSKEHYYRASCVSLSPEISDPVFQHYECPRQSQRDHQVDYLTEHHVFLFRAYCLPERIPVVKKERRKPADQQHECHITDNEKEVRCVIFAGVSADFEVNSSSIVHFFIAFGSNIDLYSNQTKQVVI